jgi:endonuclease/exonuclease/phosphatase (EEP) superfamily protein YafD
MRPAEQLRAEVRGRLHRAISTTLDPAQRRDDAERALELAQQAEIIESLPDDVEGLCVTIVHYSNMLVATADQRKQRVLAELLQDAEDKIQQISSPKRLPRQRRAA